ncbi:neuropilin-2a [Lampris incognitus]|uniref:neuropilin-2a n=1 Tax=Lampris incognitus TaxID=2546036 RepID=UPI0024B5BE94|nr:neuropilin-2a [Lampris incognitus]
MEMEGTWPLVLVALVVLVVVVVVLVLVLGASGDSSAQCQRRLFSSVPVKTLQLGASEDSSARCQRRLFSSVPAETLQLGAREDSSARCQGRLFISVPVETLQLGASEDSSAQCQWRLFSSVPAETLQLRASGPLQLGASEDSSSRCQWRLFSSVPVKTLQLCASGDSSARCQRRLFSSVPAETLQLRASGDSSAREDSSARCQWRLFSLVPVKTLHLGASGDSSSRCQGRLFSSVPVETLQLGASGDSSFRCQWRLQLGASGDSSDQLWYDFIEIRDGTSDAADVLGRHCSNIAPAPIISSGPSLQIRFVSDYAHQGAGFSLRYEIFRTGSEFCFRNFTSSSGMIESPGFPDKYPHNLECSYMIIAPPHMDITLTFLTFDLENDPLLVGEGDCKYDWLDVWDGLPQVGPLIGRYCGTKIPPEIQSSSGLLSLSFHTDMAVAKDGFSARYNMTHKKVSDSFHCSTAFGMESGKISDDQITASSSFYDNRWSPRQARLNNDDNAWTPAEDSNKEYIQVDLHFLKVLTGIVTQGAVSKETQKSYYVTAFKLEVSTNGEDWMVYRHVKNHKVDLGVPKMVRGVITQGARGGDTSTGATTDNRAFVRKYKVAHSLDGKEWSFIMEPKMSLPKIFEGNTHYDTPELRRFEETLAQYIRLYPERWSPAGIGMRVEILGCDLPETSTPAETATPTLPAGLETSATPMSTTVAGSSPSDGVCDFDHGLCGWTNNSRAPLLWSLHQHELNSYLYMEASSKTQQQQARLLSPVVGADTGPLCLLFSYQLWGEAQGNLRVLLQDVHHEETLLWELKGDQGPLWKEGRTVLPRSPKDFQVVMEGFFDHSTKGYISIDNIVISSSTPLEDCTQPFTAFPPDMTGGGHPGGSEPLPLPALSVHWYYIMAAGGALLLLAVAILVRALCCCRQHLAAKKSQLSVAYHSSSQCFQYSHWSTNRRPVEFGDSRLFTGRDSLGGGFSPSGWNTAAPSSDPPVTRVSEKDNSWLSTLDPILVTIIVMSSLGVLLGAVCAGLLLYCTCSYSGLSSRSSTTLENYNFELYDGLKHKVKLNQQRCCTEA